MKRKRLMGIGVFIVTFAWVRILDYIYEAKGIVITPYSIWEVIHISSWWLGVMISLGLYIHPGLEEINIKCKLGSHDFEWSKSSLVSPIKRETGFHIYFLLWCKRCTKKGLLDMIVPNSGLRLFPMQRMNILTDEEFEKWNWVDPNFKVGGKIK